MATLKTNLIEPEGATTTLTIGESGGNVVIGADSIKNNVYKDSGGNILFQSDGSGTLSNLNSALKGNLALLTTQTASNQASISFTSGIDSTYDVYIFKLIDINPATNLTRFNFQVNASGQTGFNETMTTTYFDAYHYESGDPYGPELRYVAAHDQGNGTSYQNLSSGNGSGSDECLVGELYLFAPSSTTYVKNFYATIQTIYPASGADSAATFNNFIAGYIDVAAAITEIDFKMTAGNMDGTIKMYGLK